MKVQLRYAAFDQTCRILIDGQPLPMVSHLARYQAQPFEEWCGVIAQAIAEEVNGRYELEYTGRSCEARILGQMVRENSFCTSFQAKAPQIPDTAIQRLKKLSSYVQSGLSCPRMRHTIYLYTDTYGYLAEELNIPKLAFCKIQLEVQPLAALAAHPSGEPAYIIMRDGSDNTQLPSVVTGSSRVLVERITDRPKGMSAAAGYFTEYINEINAAALLSEYLEMWSYADLLVRAIRGIHIDESHPTYLQFLALDKQEPVTVVKLPASIEFGVVEPIRVRSIPSGVPTDDVAYRISDDSILQLTPQGLKAVGVGEVVVEAYRAGQNLKIASQIITCYRRNRVTQIHVEPSTHEMIVGDTFNLTYSYAPQDADDASKISVTSSNGLIAVAESGQRIRARAPGTCVIRVMSEKASAACNLRVYPALQELSLSLEKSVLKAGETAKLNVERIPNDAILEKLVYTVTPSNLGRYEPAVKGFFGQNPGTGELIVSSENGRVVSKIPVTVKPGHSERNTSLMPMIIGGAGLIALVLFFLFFR